MGAVGSGYGAIGTANGREAFNLEYFLYRDNFKIDAVKTLARLSLIAYGKAIFTGNIINSILLHSRSFAFIRG